MRSPKKIDHPRKADVTEMRKILLIEPNYKNKYPPLGLMKISAYHKLLGDKVVFFKGKPSEYIQAEKFEKCLNKIQQQELKLEDWDYFRILVKNYLRLKRRYQLAELCSFIPFDSVNTIKNILKYFAFEYKPEKQWDRVYVTTLFTFYWNITKKAIDFAQKIAKSSENLYVGGVAASLITDIIADETGLVPGKNIITGLLDKPGILDDNKYIIDELVPDYSILEISGYKYPLDTGFLTYMTKGCPRGCDFCAVPRLEPQYKNFVPFKSKIETIREKYGDRKDLVLMDNNVLASPMFKTIVESIIEMGFHKGAKFVAPNYFLLWHKNLKAAKEEYNKKKYLELIFNYLTNFGHERIVNPKSRDAYYQLLHDAKLDNEELFNEMRLCQHANALNHFIEKYRNKAPKVRYVDFNQGIDCRYIDEEKMELLSRIPIRPMRIAFDSYSLRKKYENSIRLAKKYSISSLSNYILYNHKDKPEDFWRRLTLNLTLNEELNVKIFSFPMKYVPLYGRSSLGRTYVGPHWNPKYLRAVQNVLNVTKGIVMPGKKFFEKAFGKTLDEFFEIMILPEPYILYRFHFEGNGKREKWLNQYNNFSKLQLLEAREVIFSNDFRKLNLIESIPVREFIKEHYQIPSKPMEMESINCRKSHQMNHFQFDS